MSETPQIPYDVQLHEELIRKGLNESSARDVTDAVVYAEVHTPDSQLPTEAKDQLGFVLGGVVAMLGIENIRGKWRLDVEQDLEKRGIMTTKLHKPIANSLQEINPEKSKSAVNGTARRMVRNGLDYLIDPGVAKSRAKRDPSQTLPSSLGARSGKHGGRPHIR